MPLPRVLAHRLVLAALALAIGTAPLADDAHAAVETAPPSADTVHVLVLRENGAGSRATAQRYIDEVMQSVARVNGWSNAVGAYQTSRRAAQGWIKAHDPHYGILSLTAFLALRGEYHLSAIGQAEVKGGGGEQYYLVSKTAKDLADCKGQSLATNHAEDEAFIDRVVAEGFSLSDFQVVKTRRPLQTIKKVLRDEATCALIDDAQMSDLGNIEGGEALKPVWFSAKLPPMVVVAFGSAPKAEAKAFKKNLSKVCRGEGKAACGKAGIESLSAVDAKAYAGVVDAYGS